MAQSIYQKFIYLAQMTQLYTTKWNGANKLSNIVYANITLTKVTNRLSLLVSDWRVFGFNKIKIVEVKRSFIIKWQLYDFFFTI
jgi:hypothetical protein